MDVYPTTVNPLTAIPQLFLILCPNGYTMDAPLACPLMTSRPRSSHKRTYVLCCDSTSSQEFEKTILPRFDRDRLVKVFISGKEEEDPQKCTPALNGYLPITLTIHFFRGSFTTQLLCNPQACVLQRSKTSFYV
jgi:hypothetical protein